MMLKYFKRRSPARHVEQLTKAEIADLQIASAWGLSRIQWNSLTDFERAECRRNVTTELSQGAPVRYWPGFRDGASKLGRLRSGIATIGGTDGYYVTGAGFISAGHIEELTLDGGTIHVATASEALEVCDWEGVEDVVITDNAERIKMQKLLRGFRP